MNHTCIHLENYHSVKTSKTNKTTANVAVLDGNMSNNHRDFSDDPMHFCSNLIGLMTVKQSMTFSMCDRHKVRTLMHRIPLKDSGLF